MTNTDTTGTVPYAAEEPARMEWAKHAPEVYKAMVRLDVAARKGLDPKLAELVKIRASQLNHCAFCLDMHSKDALAAARASSGSSSSPRGRSRGTSTRRRRSPRSS